MTEDHKPSVRPVALCLMGSIAAGKTAVAAFLAARHDTPVLSPDLFWERGQETYSWECSVRAWAGVMAEVYEHVKLGRSFLVDAAGHSRAVRRELVQVVRAWDHRTGVPRYRVVGLWVQADLETCLSRNRERGRPQPDEVVRGYWEQLHREPPDARLDGYDRLVTLNNGAGAGPLGDWLPTAPILDLPK